MTYSLPFGLKQKPVNKYFIVKRITKTVNAVILKGEVKSKAHLDKLLSIKDISEIPAIEVVN